MSARAPKIVHVAVAKPDGTVAILWVVAAQPPRDGIDGWARDVSDAVIEAEIKAAGIEAVEWCRIDPEDLPGPRNDPERSSWRLVNGRVIRR